MIEELKRFLLVATTGNVTRAAQKSFITQSALTQSIQRLEKELQTKLFYHRGKQLTLTEDGKSLVMIGDKMLQLWKNAHDQKIRNSHIQTFAIGMFDNVALLLREFLVDNMQTSTYKLELTIDASSRLLKMLQLGTLDTALCVINKSYQISDHIVQLQTFSEKLIPVSSKHFSQSLKKIPFIVYSQSHTRTQIEETFAQHSIQPIIYAESTSTTFIRELALLGRGVALLPENFVKNDIDQGRLKIQKMPLTWKRDYGLFVQKQYALQTPFITNLQTTLGRITE
jgi:DNA-binding transcriptional LysR family regulator